MKIGIITFHFVHNQGAVLQCYALQQILQKMGHEPYVIDYRPAYHIVRYAGRKNPFVLARNNWIKHCNDNILKKFYYAARGFFRAVRMTISKSDVINEKLFDGFINSYLKLTKRYKSYRQLIKEPPEMDAFIAGSDQLWNSELCDQRLNPAYFLMFGTNEVIRIAYAVSLKEHYSVSEKEKLKEYCENIDYLSVREKNYDLLEVTDKKVELCIDPTLLLSQEEYYSIESEIYGGKPYIFVYGFETSPEMVKAVRTISEKLKLLVINGSPTRVNLDIKSENILNYAPDEFLTYIKNANYIVTNSFHGTVFSIIYHKSFTTVLHKTRGQRMFDLLDKLNISNRIYGSPDYTYISHIDYQKVDKKIMEFREHSIEYLNNSLDAKRTVK